jgi:hypothetical protein
MLAIQYDQKAADRALETELIKKKRELSRTTLYEKLEELLRQEEWRAADEETAWIFYQLMILEDFDNFYHLYKNFPCKELDEIDALWVNYSDGQFGFSVQKKIWESVGGTWTDGMTRDWLKDIETWEKFGKRVGWFDKEQGRRAKYWNSLCFSRKEAVKGEIPALWSTKFTESVFGRGAGFEDDMWGAANTLWAPWDLFSGIKA